MTSEKKGKARGILTASPLVWILLVVAAGWAVWSTATKGSGKPTATRAVAVPTDGPQDRTVAALPCSALSSESSSSGALQHEGADTVVLPKASGLRIVLVPSCASGGGTSGGGGSAQATGGVIVLPPGAPMPAAGKEVEVSPGGSGSSGAKAKVGVVFRVPESSSAGTIIVPPCSGKPSSSGKGSLQPQTVESGRGIILVPPCSATSGGS